MKKAKSSHKRTRAELKADLMKEAESVVDQLLDWHAGAAEPTLSQIEDTILKLRRQLGAKMAQTVIQDQEAVRPVPGPDCPQCGREMHYKGPKPNTVETRVGGVTLERGYYYCETCRRGVFPPGSSTGAVGEPLE